MSKELDVWSDQQGEDRITTNSDATALNVPITADDDVEKPKRRIYAKLNESDRRYLESIFAETEALPVSGKVPLSLHPDIIDNQIDDLMNSDTAGPGVIRNGRRALANLYQTYSDMIAADEELRQPIPGIPQQKVIHGSRMALDPVRATEFKRALDAALNRSAKQADIAIAQINGTVEALDRVIDRSFRLPANTEGAKLAPEIRSHIKSIASPAERANWVMQQLKNGSIEVANAIVDSPPFLSGLDRDKHDLALDVARQSLADVPYRQKKAALKVREAVENAASKVAEQYVKLIPQISTARSKQDAVLKRLAGGKS